MKKWIAGPAVAGLMVLATGNAVGATTPPTPPTTTSSENNDDDSGKLGLLGLVGLAGLAGLAGLKRRNDPYDGRRDATSTGGSSVR